MTLKTLPIIQPSTTPQQQIPSSLYSWVTLNTRRRIIFFILFSPVIVPILCLTLPLICLTHIYNCLCHRRRQREKIRREEDVLRRCEEGRCDEEREREIGWMLLQRYLEDQLVLVGSVVASYNCGEDDDDEYYYDDDDEDEDEVVVDLGGDESRRPLLD